MKLVSVDGKYTREIQSADQLSIYARLVTDRNYVVTDSGERTIHIESGDFWTESITFGTYPNEDTAKFVIAKVRDSMAQGAEAFKMPTPAEVKRMQKRKKVSQ